MTALEVNITLSSPRPSSGQDPNAPIIAVSSKPIDCPPNHVIVRVDRFGFSANNVTYQALGEHPHFRYRHKLDDNLRFSDFAFGRQGTLTSTRRHRQLMERAPPKRMG